jgi:hypothetical protein
MPVPVSELEIIVRSDLFKNPSPYEHSVLWNDKHVEGIVNML